MRLVYGGIFNGPLESGGRAGFLEIGHTVHVLLDSSWQVSHSLLNAWRFIIFFRRIEFWEEVGTAKF